MFVSYTLPLNSSSSDQKANTEDFVSVTETKKEHQRARFPSPWLLFMSNQLSPANIFTSFHLEDTLISFLSPPPPSPCREVWAPTVLSFFPSSAWSRWSTSGWWSQRPRTRPSWRSARCSLRGTKWRSNWVMGIYH